MSNEPKQYFHLLSALRGIAAILVVLRHTAPLFTPIQFQMSYMAVDLFFLLSGVVIEASYQHRLRAGLPPLHFVWIRLIRIYPLYLLGILVTLLAILLARGHLLLNGTIPYVIPHKLELLAFAVTLLPNPFIWAPAEFPFDQPAWSLFFELAVNVAYGFIATKLSLRHVLLIAASCGLGLLACLLYFHHIHMIEMGCMRRALLGGFLRTGFSFFLGVALFRIHAAFPLSFITPQSAIVSGIVIAFIVAILVTSPPGGHATCDYILSVFVLFPAIIYAALSVVPGKSVVPLWVFLGDTSYSVYTLHFPLYFFLCSVIAVDFDVSLNLYAPWIGVWFLAFVIAISHFLDRVFDLPLRRFLRGLWHEGEEKRAASAEPAISKTDHTELERAKPL